MSKHLRRGITFAPYRQGHKNIFGRDYHVTDELVHWSQGVELSQKLRTAYDKIVAAGLLEELLILTEAVADIEATEAAELEAGESI